jgi:hypothetical protein
MSILDEIRRTQTPKHPPRKGKVWVSMLIEFNYVTGESKILKSFANPAKDSNIGKAKKEEEQETILEINQEINKTNLF